MQSCGAQNINHFFFFFGTCFKELLLVKIIFLCCECMGNLDSQVLPLSCNWIIILKQPLLGGYIGFIRSLHLGKINVRYQTAPYHMSQFLHMSANNVSVEAGNMTYIETDKSQKSRLRFQFPVLHKSINVKVKTRHSKQSF